MLNIPSKLPQVGTNIFTVMSALAQEHKAVNLGQGFPDFGCDPVLLESVHQAMLAGHNQYPPMPGSLKLRQVIADKVASLYGKRYDVANEITVTAGATQAILTAILSMVHPGDEVIVIEPCYDSYVPNILLVGGIPKFVSMTADFKVDWAAVKAAITPKTKAILTNTPHNPSGRIFTQQDMLALQDIVTSHGLYLIADEVYEHMVFDGQAHQSASSYPALAERSFVISSFGKTYHVTGWKIAYCAAPQALMKEFRKVHQFTVFTVNSPAQEGIAHFMQDPQPYLQLPAFYQAKRDALRQMLSPTELQLLPCEGTYFQTASFTTLKPRASIKLGQSDLESENAFAHWLTIQCGVTVIPLSAFYSDNKDQKLVRFCFAKKSETLNEAASRLSVLAV